VTGNIQTRASREQKAGREKLLELFRSHPLPPDQLLTNLALFMRSSVTAKLLYLNELYQLILPCPGVIMEFGVWWGQSLVTFESYRAIYEPYNYTRRVIGFDTFTGYESISSRDGDSSFVSEGAYSVAAGYEGFLAQLLAYHEQENVMGHLKKHEVIKGDATSTIVDYLAAHPETVIALAVFDLQLYEPTKKCLQAIRPHLTRGSVIALDEINCPDFPGETLALQEVFGLENLRISRSRFLPDRSYIVFD
jgi:hypothetical protein